MQIDIDLLYTWGAVAKEYKKGDIIFEEDAMANFYFQIVDGCVKMFNTNDNGKEFTQGYFFKGQGFGEPPLFIDEKYPAAAMAFHDTKIVKLSKDKFLKILDENPSIQKCFLTLMARRIHSKAKTSKDIINQNPGFRILAFLKARKKGCNAERELIPYTRQEIANFTGLRVETVIRALTKLKEQRKIEIKNHKVYY
jgi:CRP/FNR family transcriptional regulator